MIQQTLFCSFTEHMINKKYSFEIDHIEYDQINIQLLLSYVYRNFLWNIVIYLLYTNKLLIHVHSILCCPWGVFLKDPPPRDSDVHWLYRSRVRGEFPDHLLTFSRSRSKGERRIEM